MLVRICITAKAESLAALPVAAGSPASAPAFDPCVSGRFEGSRLGPVEFGGRCAALCSRLGAGVGEGLRRRLAPCQFCRRSVPLLGELKRTGGEGGRGRAEGHGAGA